MIFIKQITISLIFFISYNLQNIKASQEGSPFEHKYENGYILKTAIPEKYLRPQDYNHKDKKNSVWNTDCTVIRQNYISEEDFVYNPIENHFYNQKPENLKSSQYKELLIEEYGDQADYEYGKKLGSGFYANVFKGVQKQNNTNVVIKNLNDINLNKIKREYQTLKLVQNCSSVIKLLDIFPLYNETNIELSKTHNKLVFKEKTDEQEKQDVNEEEDGKKSKAKKARAAYVYEFVTKNTLVNVETFLKDFDMRCIIYDTLKALAHTHSKGIIHRDIKPANILYDLENKDTKLIDYGLAEFFHIEKPYHYRVSTKAYKPPELLLNFTCYDYSIDTWSVGVTMAQIVYKKRPLFRGKEDYQVLQQILNLYGTDKLLELMEKLDLKMDVFVASKIPRRKEAQTWAEYTKKKIMLPLLNDQAEDLLKKLMEFDFTKRISPQDALQHPYFDPIRDFREGKVELSSELFKENSDDPSSERESISDQEIINNDNKDNTNNNQQKKQNEDL